MGQTIEKLKSEASKLAIPAKALGDVFIDTTEKLSTQQFKSYHAYSSIYFAQLKKIPDIQNFEDAGSFFWGQIEPISEFNKQLLNDWKSLVGLNAAFISETKAVFAKPKPAPAQKPKKPATKKTAAPKPEAAPAQTAAASKSPDKPAGVTKISKSRSATARKTGTTTARKS